jgi:hypothetical protein
MIAASERDTQSETLLCIEVLNEDKLKAKRSQKPGEMPIVRNLNGTEYMTWHHFLNKVAIAITRIALYGVYSAADCWSVDILIADSFMQSIH